MLFAVGAKLALIDLYATDQPYADQWAAEGVGLVRAPLYHPLGHETFFALHGEHRPALTRLWALGLIVANGQQWDGRVEVVANLAIYAAFLFVLWKLAAAAAPTRWQITTALFGAVLFSLPCAYENFLWGFQSNFLFLLLAGVLHLDGTLRAERPDWKWGGAQLAGFAGLFANAAGTMSAAAVLAFAVLAWLRGRRDAWVVATLAVNAALVAFGLFLLPPGEHGTLGWSALLGKWGLGLAYLLSWPYAMPAWCVLLQAPLLGLVFVWFKGGLQDKADRLVLALGFWAVLMAFTIAYGRGVEGGAIGVRYVDVLLVGLFANALALLRLRPHWPRRLWVGVGLAWALGLGSGLVEANKPSDLKTFFAYQRGLAERQAQALRDYMATQDETTVRQFDEKYARFPHLQLTLDLLADPKVYPFLPPSLTPDHHEGPLSKLARRVAGWWLLALASGGALLAMGAYRRRRQSVDGESEV